MTGKPPATCPRCGGILRETDPVGTLDEAAKPSSPSFVSYLRPDEDEGADAQAASKVTDDLDAPTPHVTGETVAIDADATIAPVAEAVMEMESAQPAEPEARVAAAAEAPLQIATTAARAEPELPSFTRQAAASRVAMRAPRWQLALLPLLAALLGLQVLLADRERLAADAGWRPMIVALCNTIGCSVPAWRQPAAIAMLSRNVSPIPGSVGGLNVQATFRNDARWAQPWPVLLLSLSDADGRVLGSRAFTPAEYLGAAVSTQTELAPGQSAQVALELREPGAGVVAFSFDFR